MEQKRLNLYTVNMKYIRNLHNQGDDRVFSVSPQVGKDTRPFVGIVIICEEKQYCIPLSSPKDKHKNMKNGVDFHRVLDADGKLIGVLDFNNMIPVNNSVISRIDIRPDAHDAPSTAHYKRLMAKQLTFCQKNRDTIIKKANKLYQLITSGKANHLLTKRCCDFSSLESILKRYKP